MDMGTVIVEKMNNTVAIQVMVIHYHEVPKFFGCECPSHCTKVTTDFTEHKKIKRGKSSVGIKFQNDKECDYFKIL